MDERVTNKKGLVRNILKNKEIYILATCMLLSSTIYAGEHSVDTFDKYMNAIKSDISKQEALIKVNYSGMEKYHSKVEVGQVVESLYDKTIENLSDFDHQNIFKAGIAYAPAQVSGKEEYLLRIGQYKMTYKNTDEELLEVNRIVNEVLTEIIVDAQTDYEVVEAIYNYVIETLHYEKLATGSSDETNLLAERNILKGIQGEGVVCDAYAMLLSKMLTNQGYENVIVNGEARGEHAWNMVQLDGKWYNLDPTWGDSGQQSVRETFFLVPDSVLSDNDHVWEKDNSPTSDNSYLFDQINSALTKIDTELKSYTTLAQVSNAREDIKTFLIGINKMIIEVEKKQSNTTVLDVQSSLDAQEIKIIDTGIANRINEFISSLKEVNTLDIVEEKRTEVPELREQAELIHDKALKEEVNANLDEFEEKLNIKEQQIIEGLKDKGTANLIREAKYKVALAEGHMREVYFTQAQVAVYKLEDTTIREELQERIKVVEEAMQIATLQKQMKKAETSVALAEKYKKDIYIFKAQEAIKELKEGIDKGELNERIQSVIKSLKVEDKTLEEATRAVESAEKYKTSSLIRKATQVISKVEAGAVKDALLERINNIK